MARKNNRQPGDRSDGAPFSRFAEAMHWEWQQQHQAQQPEHTGSHATRVRAERRQRAKANHG